MGYCYDHRGRLVCDCCGASGDTKRRRCPYGYCPSVAMCEGCWKDKAKRQEWKDYHIKARCKENHEAFEREQQERRDLLAAERLLRCAALSVGKGWVRVWFESSKRRPDRSLLMSHATYDAIPLGCNATVEDYERHGQLYADLPEGGCKDLPADYQPAPITAAEFAGEALVCAS